MPRPIARDKNGILYTTDPSTSQWRPLSDEEKGSLTPVGALDEMGVTGGERFTIKNLAASPGAALAFLRARGYEAVQYGDGLNFAVRKDPSQAWKLVDPSKGGLTEVWRDLTDLLGDVAVGGATALGTIAGGGLASIATGAASGAAAEAGRQALGAAAGIPDNVSAGGIAASAVGGGVAGPVGKLVGSAVRGTAKGIARATGTGGIIGRVGEQVAQRIGGIKPLQGVEVSEVILETAARRGRPVFRPADLVSLFRQHLDDVAEKDIGHLTKIRDGAITEEMTVDVSAFGKSLGELADVIAPGKILRATNPEKAALQDAARAILQPPSEAEIALRLGIEGNPGAIKAAYRAAVEKWEAGLKRMPARAALRLKKVLQNIASSKGGFATAGQATPGAVAPATSEETRALSQFIGRLTDSLHDQLPKKVAALDKLLSLKVRARNGIRDLVGADVAGAENRIRNAFAPGNEWVKDAFVAYDRAFPGLRFTRIAREAAGTRVVPRSTLEAVRQSAVGSRMTPIPGAAEEFGLPGQVARMAATGQFLGTTLLGAGTGALVGGPLGALAGAAAAPFLLSPAMIVRMAPFTVAANAAVSRMASSAAKVASSDFIRTTVQALGTSAAQATGRRIASQDRQGRRRAVFIGS